MCSFKKNVFNESFTKIIAFLLILIMTLSNVTVAFANNGSVSGEVGGGGNSGMGSSTDSKYWSSRYSGYRFYIIDKDFTRVTPIYDFVFTDPTSKECNVGEVLKSTRFDGAGSPTDVKIKSISTLASLTGSSVSDIPVPVYDGKGRGEEFRDWFLQGQAGGGTLIPGTSLIPNSTTVKHPPANNKDNSSTSEGVAQQDKHSGIIQTCINLGKSVTTLSKSKTIIKSLTQYERSEALKVMGSAYEIYDLLKEKAPDGLSKDELQNYAVGRLYISLRDANVGLKQTLFIIGFINATDSNGTIVVSLPLEESERLCSSEANRLLEEKIPLADSSTSTPNSPVVTLLNDPLAIKVPGFTYAAEALVTGDYYLIVEPITWLNIQHTAGHWNSNYNSYRTYGTYYNIANSWRGNANGGFYESYMSTLGNNCMIVTGTVETSTGKILSPVTIGKRDISSSVAEMNNKNPYMGLSMHLYSSNDLLGDVGLTVIKNYIDESGAVCKDNVVEVATSNTYNISDEGNYTVIQWETSTNNPPTEIGDRTPWEPITETSTETQKGSTPTNITVTPDEKVIYIQLQLNPEKPIEADWVIEESEITKQFNTKTNSKTSNIPSLYMEIGRLDDSHNHPYRCGDCVDTNDDGEDDSCYGHDDYKDMNISDRSLSIDIKNNQREAFSKIIAFNSYFVDKVNPEKQDFIRDSHDAYTEEIKLNEYKFIAHRGLDKLKLASYRTENTNHVSVLSSLSYAQADKNTSPERKKTNYAEKVNIILDVDHELSDLVTTSACESCNTTDTDTANRQNPIMLNDNEILVKVYSGRSTSTDKEVNNNPKLTFGLNNFHNTMGRMVQSNTKIQFYPYIQMTYVTLDSNKNDVFILSEFQRTVLPNDYAEIAWGDTEENLRITSNQWSTHAGALELSKEIFGQPRMNIMLPGGAVYGLDTKTADGKRQNLRKVLFNTYQTIVPEDEEVQASTTVKDGELTEAGAINEHEMFVTNGYVNLSNSYLKMFITTELKAENAWSSGIEVFNGADIRKLGNGSTNASSDDKYYFKQKDELNINVNSNEEQQVPANCGTFDVNIGDKTSVYHRVFSDTKGNIIYTNGSNLKDVMAATSGKILFSKKDNYSLEGISDSKARMIDQRTGFIRKFMTAIERNTGNDTTASWAPDGAWYNEAYKGIVVMEQSTPLEIGLIYPNQRTTVMDPKLIPKVTGKMERDDSGKLKFEAFLFQYKTSLQEDVPVSTFKGADVFMKNADELFKSNKAFIINMTVQDLS